MNDLSRDSKGRFIKGHKQLNSGRTHFDGSIKYWSGKKLSKDHILKLSLSHKGKKPVYSFEKGHAPWNKGLDKSISTSLATVGEKNRKKLKGRMLGDKHHLWKGDDVGYGSLHEWVKRYLGTPTTCECCGMENLTKKKIHWANKSRKYKRDLDDWVRLCVSCHWKYDKNQGGSINV